MTIFSDLLYNTSEFGYIQCNNSLTNQKPKLNFCMGTTKIPNALIIGDSHADDKFYGIEKNLDKFNWMLIGNSSCPPLKAVSFRSADGTECTERLSKLFNYINQMPTPNIVVLSFSQTYAQDKLIAADHIQKKFDLNDSVIVDLENPDIGKHEAFYSGLRRTVAFLNQKKIKVIISLDVPELEFFPFDCLKNQSFCFFSKDKFLLRQEVHRTEILNIASDYNDVFVFDPLPLFCKEKTDDCSIIIDGRSLYRDSHHLSHFGSMKYGEIFSEWYSTNIN